MVKSAFTLIELIFAIVIIAISVVSLPMMNQSISKGISSNIIQEGIFAAATELNEVVTASWDENSREPGFPDMLSRVIDMGDCDTNNTSPRFRLMPGHINQPLHRKCLDLNITTPDDGADTTTVVDDLENKVHGAQNIFTLATNDQSGYKESYQSIVSVTRPAFFAGANNANIKYIESNVTNASGVLVVRLRTYSVNIGEVDYYKRTY